VHPRSAGRINTSLRLCAELLRPLAYRVCNLIPGGAGISRRRHSFLRVSFFARNKAGTNKDTSAVKAGAVCIDNFALPCSIRTAEGDERSGVTAQAAVN